MKCRSALILILNISNIHVYLRKHKENISAEHYEKEPG
jgi:hypothetical protein